jgi:hypothetical protein
LQHKFSELLAVQRFDQISAACPAKIEGTFDLPKVSELVLANGRENVELYIRFELIILADLINVGGNLTTPQVSFIASELVNLFPNETLADFKLCFQRAARGDYNTEKDIFRLDGIVVRRWMEQYLEEKYRVMEDKLMKEKDEIYQQPIPVQDRDELAKKYLDIMEKQLRPDGMKTTLSKNHEYMQALKGISQQEINAEGQERPKASEYQMPSAEWLEQRKKERYEFQEKTVRERHPEWTEEQIQARLKELRKNDV